MCVCLCVRGGRHTWPHLCVSPAIFPASRGFALISSWIPLECSDRFTWIRSEPASTPPKPSAFNIKLPSSLLPLKCRACIWVQSHVLSPAPPWWDNTEGNEIFNVFLHFKDRVGTSRLNWHALIPNLCCRFGCKTGVISMPRYDSLTHLLWGGGGGAGGGHRHLHRKMETYWCFDCSARSGLWSLQSSALFSTTNEPIWDESIKLDGNYTHLMHWKLQNAGKQMQLSGKKCPKRTWKLRWFCLLAGLAFSS